MSKNGWIFFRNKRVGCMNQKKIINQRIREIFWIFVIGSLVGCIYETILCFFQRGCFESRQGLVYGPFTPVYGAGAVIFMLLLEKRKNVLSIFLVSAFTGGLVEYLFSFFQQFFFGTISWDYHNKFNLFGRTSLFHAIVWGILGVLFIKLVLPFILKFLRNWKESQFRIITLVVMVFMSFNIIISWKAATRQDERTHNIKAQGILDRFFDARFPDERMNKIYANKKVIGE